MVPDWGGCRFDGEEKEECAVIARYEGGGGGDRSVDNVELLACCWRGGVCICSAGEREGDGWWRCHGLLIVSIYCSSGSGVLGWAAGVL